MKEHFRILLLPLKLPKTSPSSVKPLEKSLLLASPALSGGIKPAPFLFVHLSKSLTKTTNPSTGLSRRRTLTKFLNWGEAKWQEYGEAPQRSIKGVMYRIGSFLLDKIPITEKQLWRLNSVHQHFVHLEPADLRRMRLLEIETGSIYLTDEMAEQTLKFDLTAQLNAWAAYHRRWSIFSSCMIVPVAILSILPFGKLFLAWIIFRAVAHWRAYRGAHFLSRCFNFDRQDRISDILPVKLTVNPVIDRFLPLPAVASVSDIFTSSFKGLAEELELGELANVLPKALKLILKQENDKHNINNDNNNNFKRRKFSNQNFLEP